MSEEDKWKELSLKDFKSVELEPHPENWFERNLLLSSLTFVLGVWLLYWSWLV